MINSIRIKSLLYMTYNLTSFLWEILTKKNIFFFPFYHTGGAEKVHLDIVKSFPKKDTIVVFTNVSYNNHFLEEFEKHANAFHYHKFKHNLYFRKIVFKIFSNLRNSNKITVFGCNSSYFYDILNNIPQNVKKIDLLHAFTLPDIGGAEIYSLNKIPFLDKRMVINQKTKNDFINLYKENNISLEFIERIKIINIAVEIPQIKPLKKINKDKKLNIIFCGRISKEKRVHLIVDIAKKVTNIADVKIYGHKEIDVEGIDSYFQKNITNADELKKIYENADILLISSYREGFPVVIKEAMANGVVCISTDVGSVSEHIINNETGYIVNNSGNEEKIVNNFVSIINNLSLNHNLLKNISDKAFEHAQLHFNMKHFQLEIRNLLN